MEEAVKGWFKAIEMTKNDIIGAAFRVWGDALFSKTSLSALADELGCTKPALYRHFQSKDDLMDAMYAAYYDRLSAFLMPRYQKAQAAEDVNAALVIIAEAIGEFFVRNKEEFLFSIVRVYGSDTNEQALRVQFEKCGIDLEKILSAAEDVGENTVEGGGVYKMHPSRTQMMTGTVLVRVSQEIFGANPEERRWAFSPPDEKPDTNMPVFLSALRESVLHGLGFIKERVEQIDYEKLEDAVSFDVVFNSGMDEIHLKLLKAVGEVLAETDPFDASMKMFAKKSGLSKSSLYTHFESREEMIILMFAHEFKRIVAIAVHNKAKSAVPEEQVYLALNAIAQYLRKHTMILRAIDKARTRQKEHPKGHYPSKAEAQDIIDEIFAGIHIPTEQGEKTLTKRETDQVLFMLVNTLMFRPVGVGYEDVGNESIRTLFRFLTLGLDGFPDGRRRLRHDVPGFRAPGKANGPCW